jgi:PAS domain-containing protein
MPTGGIAKLSKDLKERSEGALGDVPRYKDDQIERYYRKVMEQGVPVQFQSPGFYSPSWYDVAVYPTRDGISVFATDRTEEYRALEALRESEERFRTMADGTPLIIWVTDAAGQIEFVNRSYCEFFGLTLQQVQSEGWQPLVHPEDAAGYTDVYMDCIRERRPFRAEARAYP